MQVIPFTPSNPFDEFDTQLGSETCRIVQRWNDRDEAWYFDLFTLEDELIAAGIKIVLGVPLGRRVQHPIFQKGLIVAIDRSAQARDPGFDELGARVKVCYLTNYEYAETLMLGAG